MTVRLTINGAPRPGGTAPRDARARPVRNYADHGGPKWDTGRLAAVLRKVASEIGWSKRAPERRGVDVAAHFTFGGYAANAIEVEVSPQGDLAIHRVVTAVLVAQPVNPLGIDAQMQGATIDGLSTALNLEITIDGLHGCPGADQRDLRGLRSPVA